MKEETPLRDACFQREVITQASPELLASFNQAPVKHSHYFKNVEVLTHIDVYRVLKLYNVTDPCLQHAVKKLLVAGGRGAGMDISLAGLPDAAIGPRTVRQVCAMGNTPIR